jgi:hypothetical protein
MIVAAFTLYFFLANTKQQKGSKVIEGEVRLAFFSRSPRCANDSGLIIGQY